MDHRRVPRRRGCCWCSPPTCRAASAITASSPSSPTGTGSGTAGWPTTATREHVSYGQTTLGFFPLYPITIWLLTPVIELVTPVGADLVLDDGRADDLRLRRLGRDRVRAPARRGLVGPRRRPPRDRAVHPHPRRGRVLDGLLRGAAAAVGGDLHLGVGAAQVVAGGDRCRARHRGAAGRAGAGTGLRLGRAASSSGVTAGARASFARASRRRCCRSLGVVCFMLLHVGLGRQPDGDLHRPAPRLGREDQPARARRRGRSGWRRRSTRATSTIR